MTVINKIEIDGTEYSDSKNITINRSASEYNATSDFVVEFDNYYGLHDNDFNLNDKVVVYADKDETTATTKIFTGIIEDIQFNGSGERSTVRIMGRDYAAILQDIITEPRIFNSTEASQIVTTLMTQNVSTALVTANSVNSTDTTIPKITFNNISIFDSIARLAELSGFFFYVDEDQDLHFEAKASTVEYYPTQPLVHLRFDSLTGSSFVDSVGTTNPLMKVLATTYFPLNNNPSEWNGRYTTETKNLVATEDRFGNVSGAYLFNGSDSRVTINNTNFAYAGSNFTISAWIQYTGSSLAASGGKAVILGDTYSNTTTFHIGENGDIVAQTDDSLLHTSDGVIVSGTNWNHVVWSYNIGSAYVAGSPYYPYSDIYNNGSLVKTGSYLYHTNNPYGPTGSMYVGWDARHGYAFNGKISEMLILQDACLNSDDVARLYNYSKEHNLYNPLSTNALGLGSDFNMVGFTGSPLGPGSLTSKIIFGGPYIDIGSNIQADSDNHSICWWYKCPSTDGNYHQMLFQREINGTDTNIEFNPSDNKIYFESRTNNFYDKSFDTGKDIDDGNWHHYGLVFSGNGTYLYTDGNLSATQEQNTDGANFIYRIIGGYGNTTYAYGECPTGTMDDVRIYDKPLPENEVKFIYNNGFGRKHVKVSFDQLNTLSAQFRQSDSDVYNSVKVFGERQLTGAKEIFITGTDNTGSVYELDAKPYNVAIMLSGATNTQIQPGGVYYINDPSSEDVHFLVDFQGQRVILTSGTTAGINTVPNGSQIIIDYQRSTPLIVTKSNDASIGSYGPKFKVIVDRNVIDFDEAEDMADNFLSEHKDPVIEGKISASDIITVNPGNTVIVDVPWQGINEQTYAVTNAKYEFNKRNNQNDQVLSVSLNKRIPNILDIMKEQIMRLRSLESAEVDTSITNLLAYTGSVGVSGTYKVIQSSIGSAFVFNVPNHDLLESPSSLLGRWIGGSVVLQTT